MHTNRINEEARRRRAFTRISRGRSRPARVAGLALAAATLLLAASQAVAYSADPDGDLASSALEAVSLSDAFDAGSTPENRFFEASAFGLNVCSDGLDNDGDTLIDAAEIGCSNADGDLLPTLAAVWPADDWIEYYFQLSTFSPSATPESPIIDQIISGPPFFLPPGITTCTDGVDNDLDGFADHSVFDDCGGLGENHDVDSYPNYLDSEGPYPNHNGVQQHDDCSDMEDNDGDGFIDLGDPDCVFGGDVDSDGLADMFDSEGSQPNFNGFDGADDCFDGLDNDGDAVVDLAEAECLECHGLPATLIGTAGDDVLVGTSGPDVILGQGGDDRLRGLDGDDSLCGGPGDDRVIGVSGDDQLAGGAGQDRLSGGPGNDFLQGGPGTDRLIGGPDDDTILDDDPVGPVFDDFLSGGPGNDGVGAFGGTNTLRGGGGDDYLAVLDGVNQMIGGGGNDVFYAYDGTNRLIGGGGNDTMEALDGTNEIRGGGGDDLLTGGAGQDTLDGGGGVDICDGGGGSSDVAAPNCETMTAIP